MEINVETVDFVCYEEFKRLVKFNDPEDVVVDEIIFETIGCKSYNIFSLGEIIEILENDEMCTYKAVDKIRKLIPEFSKRKLYVNVD